MHSPESQESSGQDENSAGEEPLSTEKKFWAQIQDLPDSQELYLTEMDHNSGQSQVHEITVGELKKQLQHNFTSDSDHRTALIHFDDGTRIDLDYHDYYDLHIVTPEMKAAGEKEARDLKVIDGLKKLGVDPDVFFVGDFDEFGNDARERRFSPEDIVRFGKIIEEYLAKNGA